MVLRGRLVFGERDLESECLKLREGALTSPPAQTFVQSGRIEIAIGVVAQ